MMNNPHYRVRVHVDTTKAGAMAMRFEHPTKSGSEAGGCAPLFLSWAPCKIGVQGATHLCPGILIPFICQTACCTVHMGCCCCVESVSASPC